MLRESQHQPLFLSSLNLLVCFLFLCLIFQTMPFSNKNCHFLYFSSVPVAMQVPPQWSIYALSQCKCWCETTEPSCYFTVFKHPAHKYSCVPQQYLNGILLLQLNLFKFTSLTKGTKTGFFQQQPHFC